MTNMNDEQGSNGYTSMVYDDGTIEHTHSCPQITNNGVPLTNKNMSIAQCLTRFKEQSACTFDCPIMKRILESKTKV